MKKKLTFEEVAKRIKDFSFDYELIDYVNSHNIILKYLPTGEEFKCNLRWFLLGKAHAPSIAEQIRIEKIKKTNLERYGFENPTRSKEVQDKARKTNLERYGVEYSSQNKEIKEKVKKTNLEKYGVEYSCQNKEVREKVRKTCLEKYGVENPFGNKEVKEKLTQTNIKKYGFNSFLKTEEARYKSRKAIFDKYGYDSPFGSNQVQEKVKQTNLEKYGYENPAQNKEVQNQIKQTKLERGYTKLIDGKTIKEIAEEKGLSETHLNLLHRRGIDIMNYEKSEGTSIEQIIKSILDETGISYEREKWFNDGKIRADFYIPEFNLVIEANGLYWHSELRLPKNYHFNRRVELNKLGIRVLQFNELQIIEKTLIVRSIIRNALKLNERRIFARKTQLKEVPKEEYKAFIEKYHLMGRGNESIRYGLYLGDELLMVAGFTNKENYLDCSRLCSKEGVSVVGGLSKLFKPLENFKKEIRTFIDLNYGEGYFLKDLGFEPKKAYCSFKWVDLVNNKLYNRMQFRGDTGLDHGFTRLWDSGQQNWIKSIYTN